MGERGRFRDREKALEAASKSGDTERTQVTCPRCGDEFGNLPAHLRACDGGNGR